MVRGKKIIKKKKEQQSIRWKRLENERDQSDTLDGKMKHCQTELMVMQLGYTRLAGTHICNLSPKQENAMDLRTTIMCPLLDQKTRTNYLGK